MGSLDKLIGQYGGGTSSSSSLGGLISQYGGSSSTSSSSSGSSGKKVQAPFGPGGAARFGQAYTAHQSYMGQAKSVGDVFIQEAFALPQNFAQGLYGTGKASALTIRRNPIGAAAGLYMGPLGALIGAEFQSHAQGKKSTELERKVIKPQIKMYGWKYGGATHGDFDETWHRMMQEPLGTVLDIGAVATIPFGAEGFALKGLDSTAAVAKWSAMRADPTLIRALNETATLEERGALIGIARQGGARRVAAVKMLETRGNLLRMRHAIETGRFGPLGRGGLTPKPLKVGGVEIPFPETYKVARPRTLHGRLVYEPLKRWFNGLPSEIAGPGGDVRAIDLSTGAGKMMADHLKDQLAQNTLIREAERNVMMMAEHRLGKLTPEEDFILPTMAEFKHTGENGVVYTGLDATTRAPKGAPREEMVGLIEEQLQLTEKIRAAAEAQGDVGIEQEMRLRQMAMRDDLTALGEGDPEKAALLDDLMKNPPKRLVQAYVATRDLQKKFIEPLVEATDFRTAQQHADRANLPAAIRESEQARVPAELKRVEHHEAVQKEKTRLAEHQSQRKVHAEAKTKVSSLQRLVKEHQKTLETHDRTTLKTIEELDTAHRKAVRNADGAERSATRLREQRDKATASRKGLKARQRKELQTLEAQRKRAQGADRVDKAKEIVEAKQRHVEQNAVAAEKQTALNKQLTSAEGQARTARKAEQTAADAAERAKNKAGRADNLGARERMRGDVRNAERKLERARKAEVNASYGLETTAQRYKLAGEARKTALEATKRAEVRIANDPEAKVMTSMFDGYTFPHRGPLVDARGELAIKGRPVSPLSANPPLGSDMMGSRYLTRQLTNSAQAWIYEARDAARLHILHEWHKILKESGVALDYNPAAGQPLLPGFRAVNLDGVTVTRAINEIEGLRAEHANLTPEKINKMVDDATQDMLHPESAAAQARARYQVPEELARRIVKDQKEASRVGKFYDSLINGWKILTLKYRPAWLVNNILGQHMLYALFNGGMKNYLYAANPLERKKLWRAIGKELRGAHAMGSAELVSFNKPWKLKQYQWTHGGYARKVVEGVGDAIVRANKELADNVPRTAYAIKLLKERRRSLDALAAVNGDIGALVANKSLKEVAEGLTTQERIDIVKKVNQVLGDFRHAGKIAGRALPFASWFRVILGIAKHLAGDHPEKLLLVWNMEQAAAQDPDVIMPFPVPSWLNGSIKVGPMEFGIQGAITTNALNPFATVSQLAAQLIGTTSFQTDSKGNVKPASGPESPFASVSPFYQMLQVFTGRDPFTGEAYAGPFDKTAGGPWLAGAGYPIINLPQVRLLQQVGWIPGYHEPKTYKPTTPTAIGQFLGLPYRNVRVEQAKKYAGIFG